ncbi:hypothetical protein KIW84_046079 [Lathyrus oleraceus]|uniref:Uncharacterized protein n=1 Tax=Pisum sativum TaxID=3888 RepID=A0A9D4XPV5_PEA|nr:hypothetical protein KIW84_046079 [Pisum sativum]
MTLNEVVADVRLKYGTDILGYRAFKARQLTRHIVEGDSSKQYNFLWSYGAELRRVSPGNTFKININSPVPGLPPKFERSSSHMNKLQVSSLCQNGHLQESFPLLDLMCLEEDGIGVKKEISNTVDEERGFVNDYGRNGIPKQL